MKVQRWMMLAAVGLVGVGLIYFLTRGQQEGRSETAVAAETTPPSAGSGAGSSIEMPALTAEAEIGQVAFTENCARCHGANGGGTNQGPPLIHVIYEPGHHSDLAFVLAARNGSRAHHWRFGDMPPQPQVSEEEIAAIIQFVREVQRANGIF